MKYLMTILILLLSLNQLYGAVQVDFCYVIDEKSKNLYRVAQDGSQSSTIGEVEECSVEAIAWDRIGELYMFDAATTSFYTLDLATGMSIFKFVAPTGMRADDGTVHQIRDVDSMDFDAFDSNILWCVERIPGPSPDLLFSIDMTTGLVRGNVLYPVTGVGGDIEDLGIDPLTGTTYAISSNNGLNCQLIVLDTLSGAGFVIGNLLEAGVQVDDMEGFGFDVDGQLIGTTGSNGIPNSGALYFINKGTGAVQFLTVIEECGDIESIACFNARIELRAASVVDGNDCIECPNLRQSACDAFTSPTINIIITDCADFIEVAGSCPEGSTLEYSVNAGAWVIIEPTYDDQTTEMISIRCRCDEDDSVVSDQMIAQVSTGIPRPCSDANGGRF